MQSQIVPGKDVTKYLNKQDLIMLFSSGFISYQPNKHLNIQAGHGKQKLEMVSFIVANVIMQFKLSVFTIYATMV